MSNKKRLQLDQVWPQLEEGLVTLLKKLNEGMSAKEWMTLYTLVHDYCAIPNVKDNSISTNFIGGSLYENLINFLKDHMKSLKEKAKDKMHDSLLNYYKEIWDRFTTGMKYVDHIFNYLNRYWVKKVRDDGRDDIHDVYTTSLIIWKEHLFEYLKDKILRSLLDLIQKDRNGEKIDTSLIHNIINTYIALSVNDVNVYCIEFESAFLKETRQFYKLESREFLIHNSISDYMKKVDARIQEEEKRVYQYLHSSTMPKLIEVCDETLVDDHKEQLWPEFQELLAHDKNDDIELMYRLLSRIPDGLEPIRQMFENHVLNVGNDSLKGIEDTSSNDPKLYVETLLKVHKKYNQMVINAMKSDSGFMVSLDRACRRFINDNAVTKKEGTSKSSELLAKYCDNLLKKSPKNPEEQEILEILNDVMYIFNYIEDKDIFQTFYSKMLAKRLIHGTSSSDHLEMQMINKLKQHCGFEYTSKLGRMFSDITVSKELLENLQSSEEYQKESGGIDFNVMVLATGSWPLQLPSSNFSIPKELASLKAIFTKFYHGRYSGRKLNWLHQLSKGELKAKFRNDSKSSYILQCSTYQMGILLQFNDAQEMTMKDIQIATQLTDSTLKNTLTSLIKTKVLVIVNNEEKSNNNDENEDHKEIDKMTRFRVNESFKNKRARIMINIPIREVQKKETTDTQKVIEEDRRLQIQAAIVRIMKMRKKAPHVQLMTEVISQLQTRFKPKVSAIKKCIDILIEKEYLERVENQKDYYVYKA